MRVRVGEGRLFFEVYGEEWRLEGGLMRRFPVLVGLHGGPGTDGAKARYQLSKLDDVAQVIVPDQRGHGRSDHDSSAHWNLATWAADVKGLCDALEVDHPIVLGGSFGGFVAQQYAATYPDHPAALILSSTCPRLPDIGELVERFREIGGEEAADLTRRDWDSPSEETTAEWARVCGPLLSLAGASDRASAAINASRIRTPAVSAHYFAHEAKTVDLTAGLAAIRCPTLVLYGDSDPLTPPRLPEEIVSSIPGGLARLEMIPDAAHDLLTDNPERAYSVIRSFIANLR